MNNLVSSNTTYEYVARQDRELCDQELAKQALIQWARGLHRIWSCR